MELAKDPNIDVFKNTIFGLRHDHLSTELDAKIRKHEPSSTGSNVFLIKMEIKRLAQEVKRVIDMRDLFKDSCEIFEFQGLGHYMDKESISLFKEEVVSYGNKFTVGVYEVVVSKARERYRRNPSGKNNFPSPKKSSLTHFYQRQEERLYYSVKISVFLNNPSSLSISALDEVGKKGISTDISEEGLSIKVPKGRIDERHKSIFVWFKGTEQEFSFKKRMFVKYDILKSAPKGDDIYYHLRISSEQQDGIMDEFKSFVSFYMTSQKRKYRVPVENTMDALDVKSNEQFVVTRMNSLPIFLGLKNNILLPMALFKTDNNAEISSFMHDGTNQLFSSFFGRKDVQAVFSEKTSLTVYYYFIRVRDNKKNIRLAAIPYSDVAGNDEAWAAINHATKNGGTRLMRIDCCSINPSEESHVPSSLPDSAGEAFENLNQKPIEKAMLLSNGLTKMCQFTDITGSIDVLHLSVDDDVTDKTTRNENIKKLNLAKYVLSINSKFPKLHVTQAETNDFRAEDRFVFAMNVRVSNRTRKSEYAIRGKTQNISSRGLLVDIDDHGQFRKGDEVLVDLPSLARTSDVISRQTYKVVGVNPDGALRLVINGNTGDHEARVQIRKFIYKNMNSLQPAGVENEIYGLTRVLRNLFAHNHQQPYMITSKDKSSRYVRNIAVNKNTVIPGISGVIDNYKAIDYLTQHDNFRTLLFRNLQTVNKELPYQPFHIIVVAKKKRDGSYNLIMRHVEDISNSDQFRVLYESFCQMGTPTILRVNVTKKGRVFNKYMRDELNYIAKYANVHSQECLNQWRETTGVIDIMNLTDLITE